MCVAECGSEEPFVTQTDARTGFLMCVARCPKSAYDTKLNCVDECDGLSVANGNQSMCVSTCPESAPYKSGLKCVARCEAGTFHVTGVNGEKSCEKTCDGFVDSSKGIRECVQSCPWGRFQNDCVTECPANTYLKNGVCVFSCGEGFAIDEETRTCSASCLRVTSMCVTVCPEERPLQDGLECVLTCPGENTFSVVSGRKICGDCA